MSIFTFSGKDRRCAPGRKRGFRSAASPHSKAFRAGFASAPGRPAAWSGSYSYQFDEFGNLRAEIPGGGNLPPSPPGFQQEVDTATNRVAGGTYDQLGNLLEQGNQTLDYLDQGHIRTVEQDGQIQCRYFYDADGQRRIKAPGASGLANATYYFYEGGALSSELDTSTLQEAPPVYLLTDHLGTTRGVLELDEVLGPRLIAGYDVRPFGAPLAGPVTPPSHPFFTGQLRDAETGLDSFTFRFYQSSSARWNSPDPLFMQDSFMTNPQGWNLYAYVHGNPARYTDVMGLAPEEPVPTIIDGTGGDTGGSREGDDGGRWTAGGLTAYEFLFLFGSHMRRPGNAKPQPLFLLKKAPRQKGDFWNSRYDWNGEEDMDLLELALNVYGNKILRHYGIYTGVAAGGASLIAAGNNTIPIRGKMGTGTSVPDTSIVSKYFRETLSKNLSKPVLTPVGGPFSRRQLIFKPESRIGAVIGRYVPVVGYVALLGDALGIICGGAWELSVAAQNGLRTGE